MAVPLVTDLDGTLIRTDAGLEAIATLARRRPAMLAVLLAALPVCGLAAFKRRVAGRVELDPACLPYDLDFLGFLHAQRARGRSIYLATASDEKHAHAVARHLNGLFTRVYASDGRVNLKGARKAALLVTLFGERGFDYAGDARADLGVWPYARRAILVRGTAALERRLRAAAAEVEVFSRR